MNERGPQTVELLERLADLRERGLLTDDEFDREKRLILERQKKPPPAQLPENSPVDVFSTGGKAPPADSLPPTSPLSPLTPNEPLAEGDTIGQRYRVQRLLGAGGMGQVYLVDDLERGRPIALKMLHPQLTSETFRRRFLRELEINERLTHEGIVRTYSLERDPASQTLFFTMEYVPGESLARLLSDQGPLSLERTLPLLESVAQALDYAHQQQVVHRDLKPANIMITPQDKAKILDFGIARVLDPQATATQTGFVGTAYYMAPEQLQGGPITPATDLYSLAVITFQMLTGKIPQPGLPAPSALADLPSALDRLFQRALHWEPDERFPSALAWQKALVDLLEPAEEDQPYEQILAQLEPLLRLALAEGPPSPKLLEIAQEEAARLGLNQKQFQEVLRHKMTQAGYHLPSFLASLSDPSPAWQGTRGERGVDFSSKVAAREESADRQEREDTRRSPGSSPGGSGLEEGTGRPHASPPPLPTGDSFPPSPAAPPSSSGKGPISLAARRAGVWGKIVARLEEKRPTWLPQRVPRNAALWARPGQVSALDGESSLPPLPEGARSRILLARDESPLLSLIWIPPGSFWMGAAPDDPEASNNEKPGRSVEMQDYWIARTPITNRTWQTFLHESGYQPQQDDHNGYYLRHWSGDRPAPEQLVRPVVWLSFRVVWAFCDFYGLSLPSEAQWEKAARGTKPQLYPWGNQPPDRNFCNFGGNEGGTTDVGRYPYGRSPFGLLDCAGNVYEWCADGWSPRLLQQLPPHDPHHVPPLSHGRATLRGGNYNTDARFVRCSYRYGAPLTSSFVNAGFRPVLDALR